MRSVRAKVREATGRRNVGRPVEAVVVDLNRALRGWGTSFAGATRQRSLERRLLRLRAPGAVPPRQARTALRATADVRHLPEPGRLSPDETGPRPACACLTVNDVGKPCDRDGHARFDGGREEPGPVGSSARRWRLPPTRPTGGGSSPRGSRPARGSRPGGTRRQRTDPSHAARAAFVALSDLTRGTTASVACVGVFASGARTRVECPWVFNSESETYGR